MSFKRIAVAGMVAGVGLAMIGSGMIVTASAAPLSPHGVPETNCAAFTTAVDTQCFLMQRGLITKNSVGAIIVVVSDDANGGRDLYEVFYPQVNVNPAKACAVQPMECK